MSRWRILMEPAVRPLFQAWWRFRRSTTLGVRGIVCDPDGRVLLVRHSYVRGWHLPGGGVEKGETAREALVRELAEEGGIAAEGDPRLFAVYANHAYFPNDHVLVYRIDRWTPCPPRPGNEILERGFFALDALPDNVAGATGRRLDEVFAGAPVSPHW